MAILPISRQYQADRIFMTRRIEAKFATDTMWVKKKSIRSHIATQLYTHKCGFAQPYHLLKADGQTVGNTLAEFINDFGAPMHLTFDGAAV